MTAADLAYQLEDERPDFELVAMADVGLPYWRLRVRCELLTRKAISPIDELVLRAVTTGVSNRQDLMIMLGLDEVVLDAAVVGMLREEWLRQIDTDRLALTDKGEEIEATAVQERSEERIVPFEYDGLLRKPTLLDQPLEPAQLAAIGAREIPPHPARWPDMVELQDRSSEVEHLVRYLGGGRDRELDLLALKQLVRRERVFRQATALLLRARRGNDLQVAFVVDDVLSSAHEQAFAHADLITRLGVARGVRSRTRLGNLLSDGAHERHAAEKEESIRADVKAGLNDLREASDDDAATKAETAVRRARRRLRDLELRVLECHEHPAMLEVALRTARTELMIVTPRISAMVVDRDFQRATRKLLDRGVEVRIAYGVTRDPAAGADPAALERLHDLGRDYSNLRVVHNGTTKASVLIRDAAFAIVTNFPLLAYQGDPKRTLSDERGWVLNAEDLIAAERKQWGGTWTKASGA